MVDHYEILGVRKTATPAEIKKAYKRMAKKYHPDRQGGDVHAMVLANKAYDTLMDPAKREHYDLTGEEKPISTLDIEARNSILQMFIQLASGGKVNIPAQAKRIATEATRKIQGEIALAQSCIETFRKRRDEVECTDGENLWHSLVDQQIAEWQVKIAAAEHKLAITKRVLELLQAYRSGVVEVRNTFNDAVALARQLQGRGF